MINVKEISLWQTKRYKKYYFFFHNLLLITVLHLIRDSYKNKICISESVCGIFHFSFRFAFSFCSTKSVDFLTLKPHNSFQNENNRKAIHAFAPRPLIFKLEQEVLKYSDIRQLECPKNWPREECFKLRKLKFRARQFFTIVTFK